MRKLLALLALVTLAGCDSGGSSGGSGEINMDCFSIAGDYNVPVEIAGKTENMAVSIDWNCKFATRSPSTGESYGKLRPIGDSDSYYGTGKSPACGGGPFQFT